MLWSVIVGVALGLRTMTPHMSVALERETVPLTQSSLPLGSSVGTVGLDDDAEKQAKRFAAASAPLDVFVVGLSHHNAAVETREKLAIPEAEWQEAALEIVDQSQGAVEEAAVLSTCNRFEVYFAARDARKGFAAASKYLQERSGLPMSTLRESLFMLSQEHATSHALKVSAGLDSLVVGEGQILAQMKQCYAHAVQGAGGKVTTRLLNAAVAAGKRARDETDISKGAVSISSAAYELAAEKALGDVGKRLEDANIVIVGAGKMTRLLLTHAASHGVKKCTLLNRSAQRAQDLADEFKESHDMDIVVAATGGDKRQVLPFLDDADVVFASTSSESYVVDADDVKDRSAPLMLVDISVPRNVDPACDDVPNVAAYDVDSLKAVVERNTAKRRREIVAAEHLLASEANNFRSWISTLGAVPAITQLQEKAEDLRVAEMKRANGKLANLSQREIEAVERLSRGIVAKLIHGPMSALRDSNTDTASALGLVKKMFRI